MLFIRVLFILSAMFNLATSNAQTFVSNSNKYDSLYRLLSLPDSMYVYEVSSSGADGIAFFVSFKNNMAKSGYCVSADYINNLLIPRSLMPPDSLGRMFKIDETNGIDADCIISKIHQAGVFGFRNASYDFCANNVDDGLYYKLSKIIKDSLYTISFYEVYEAAKACPDKKEIQAFIQIDKLYMRYFGEPETIMQHLLEQYMRREM